MVKTPYIYNLGLTRGQVFTSIGDWYEIRCKYIYRPTIYIDGIYKPNRQDNANKKARTC